MRFSAPKGKYPKAERPVGAEHQRRSSTERQKPGDAEAQRHWDGDGGSLRTLRRRGRSREDALAGGATVTESLAKRSHFAAWLWVWSHI